MRIGTNNAPIGVFDSGFGGLTVAREIAHALPHESILYFGDTARCPYGPRDLTEVDGFVQAIGTWLIDRGIKLLVIACNTGTAAGLQHAQEAFEIPVIGVVDPGARAAALATNSRRVGVIATQGTIDSGAYTRAIHNIDAGIKVFPAATPKFVEIAERGVGVADLTDNDNDTTNNNGLAPEYVEIAHNYLAPFKQHDIDTLVLGCTHFPLIQTLIADTVGDSVTLISSAEEVARDVSESLTRRGICAQPDQTPRYEFFTSGNDIEEFASFGSYVFGAPISSAVHVDL